MNPVDEADPREALDDLPVELSYDLLESFIENPEPVIAAVASQSPERARQLRNLHESMGDHLDLDTLLEEVEDALE